MDITARKLELEKESQFLQKEITELDQKRNQIVQRAIELRGAYAELTRIAEMTPAPPVGVENAAN